MITALLLVCVLGSDCRVMVGEQNFTTIQECEASNALVVERINSNTERPYRVMGSKCVAWGEEPV